MNLQELVERLQSHPLYQAGRAADVEVHVNTGLFPLATRRVRDIDWTAHEGTTYIVLGTTGQRAGPLSSSDFVKLVQRGEVDGHPV